MMLAVVPQANPPCSDLNHPPCSWGAPKLATNMMRRKHLLSVVLSALPLLGMSACDVGHGEVLAKQRYGNCAPCHGEDGSGNRAVGAPAIAGLPLWYVEAQLRKFRDGSRGAHPDDIDGLKMRPMARTLLSEEEVKVVAERVAKLPPLQPPVTITDGDATRGKAMFATCTACHGEKAAGMQDKGAPDLHRTGDWYLLAQLTKFKSGVRGSAPTDATGQQMRPMAATLPNEQAMKDVIAYIRTLQP